MTDPNSERTACVFCKATDHKMTKEHMPPAWVSKTLRESVNATGKRDAPFTATYGGRVHKTREIGVRVRTVCDTCNEGWLHKLEDEVKPILRPMILGSTNVSLGSSQQSVLARWAYKCALIIDEIIKPQGTRLPASCYEVLFGNQGLAPPPADAVVFLTAWRATEPHLEYKSGLQGVLGSMDALLMTWTMGVVVFQVIIRQLGVRLPGRPLPDKDFLIRLHPPRDVVPAIWPRQYILGTEAEVDRFALWDGFARKTLPPMTKFPE